MGETARRELGGAPDEVVPLGALGRQVRRSDVLVGGRIGLAAELVEVGADGVPLLTVTECRTHPLGLVEPGA